MVKRRDLRLIRGFMNFIGDQRTRLRREIGEIGFMIVNAIEEMIAQTVLPTPFALQALLSVLIFACLKIIKSLVALGKQGGIPVTQVALEQFTSEI